MRIIFLLIMLWLSSFITLKGQELMCRVEINTQQVEVSNKQVFETLKGAIYEFMNNRQWTNYTYEPDERIDCSLLITIERRLSADEFVATLTMAVTRPVFDASLNTPLLNYIDKSFSFKYIENQPLDFYQNTFTSNLTSVLAFYAYIFIGMDFDSFIMEGGTPYYESAQNIVNAAQNSPAKGWKSFDGQRNRYWLVENFLNVAYKPLRKFLYVYHRKGMDKMYDDAEMGKAGILRSLKDLQEVKKLRPGLFLLQLLVDAKRDEIINVFSEGSSGERGEAADIMKQLDPSHSREYDAMKH